jgi:hypothetical protein
MASVNDAVRGLSDGLSEMSESVTFVHAFCTYGPSFRMKSPHRSHIDSDP